MDNNEQKRPSAALINREWFDAASGVLPADGLGRVLVAAVSYVLRGERLSLSNAVEKAVFQMIVPSLDSDIARYLERCARNAANARKAAERVAASGSEWEQIQLQPQLQPQLSLERLRQLR